MALSDINTVLFDLDGTLCDTAPDLIAACNQTLEHFRFPRQSEDLIRTKATSGMRAMLRLGVPEEQWDSAGIDGPMRSFFASYYTEHICDKTRPFDGIPELISLLKGHGFKLAVVTSKYEAMAYKLLSGFEFTAAFDLILGCDSLPRAKPDPLPLLKACKDLGRDIRQTLYVGDHVNDLLAARRAGCKNAFARYGYGLTECDPVRLHELADYEIDSPADLSRLLFRKDLT